jgi:hypothetical protein
MVHLSFLACVLTSDRKRKPLESNPWVIGAPRHAPRSQAGK